MVLRRIPLDVHSESQDMYPSFVVFLWGYVKSKVNQHQLSTLEHLKPAITEEFNAISQNMLEKVMVYFRERLQTAST